MQEKLSAQKRADLELLMKLPPSKRRALVMCAAGMMMAAPADSRKRAKVAKHNKAQ